ncbi:MAG: 30S ribosomal protein S16 [bacterium]|jgi:small subunit ribosomal protein S16
MVKIRLTRKGKKKVPFYRIVVIDSKKARDGKFIERVGHYDPRSKELNLKRDRIEYWISKGAQPTNTVAKLIAKEGGQQ